MAACYSHAFSSQRKWGGEIEDYLAIHLWFHRALRHHTLGISEALKTFGEGLKLSSGRTIPTRWVCEQHMIEDFGRIPSVQDWLSQITPQPWMASRARRVSVELETKETL